MGSNISFTLDAWGEYMAWQSEDRKTINKINRLIEDITRNGNKGIGHPEPLKYIKGYWSRTIDEKNRLVYTIQNNDTVLIAHCKGHYGDT